ncbi:family 1 glycosylhydrolase [Streptomyces sp. NPDC012510]|uniref:family 1 glycosylhydrolase n=1 Tax=Streptomyces sp. NPDC012510 TaxID=3364838 RepID=UPI0036E2096E
MQLLAGAGLNSYRFGIEWVRIEPRPGQFSNAELAHYGRMIDTALELGVTPVVTLRHFTSPLWFAEEGGWLSPKATDRFVAYVSRASEILDGVEWVVTINEPNMMAMMQEAMRSGKVSQWHSPTVDGDAERERIAANLPVPTPEFAAPFIAAHHAARDVIRERTGANVGWSVANGALTSAPEHTEKLAEVEHSWENLYLEAAAGDDFIGVQSYSSRRVDANGLVPHPDHPDNTMTGAAYRPDALGVVQ